MKLKIDADCDSDSCLVTFLYTANPTMKMTAAIIRVPMMTLPGLSSELL